MSTKKRTRAQKYYFAKRALHYCKTSATKEKLLSASRSYKNTKNKYTKAKLRTMSIKEHEGYWRFLNSRKHTSNLGPPSAEQFHEFFKNTYSTETENYDQEDFHFESGECASNDVSTVSFSNSGR